MCPFVISSVSLRVNGRTIASAVSEEQNHSPVTQSALYFLRRGDVVRLEVSHAVYHPSAMRDRLDLNQMQQLPGKKMLPFEK